MSHSWPTKEKDLHIARAIMEEYAHEQKSASLGLFEIVVDQIEKRMNLRLSGWVVMIARHFFSTYGDVQGDFVTRQVISRCITQDATVH